MKPTLYVHTGSPKTGSSTIQSFLNNNREKFKEMGVCYPEPLIHPYLRGHEGHISMSEADSVRRNWHKDYKYYRDLYLKALIDARLPRSVLSAEGFCADNPEIFEPFRRHFNIKIIHYFRDIFSFLSSLVKQLAKEGLRGEELSFWTSLSAKNQLIFQRINSYIEYFGIENCIFKDFNSIRYNKCLIEDFIETIGCCNKDIMIDKSMNVTPSDAASMFFYQLSFLPLTFAEFGTIRHDTVWMDLSAWKGWRCTLLPPQAFELDDECKKAIHRQGELLGNPDWYDNTMVLREKLAAIPNHDLPPEIQHDIFLRLSEKSRSILLRYCPKASNIKTDKPFLPAINNIPSGELDLLVALRNSYCASHNSTLRQEQILHEQEQKLGRYEARDQIRAAQLRRSATGLPAVWSQIKACCQSLLSSHARQAYAIRESGLFEIPWYLERNPDVAKADIDPILHYVRCGAAEGRDPSPWFSTLSYLNRNPDVVKEGVNPFYHYICHGTTEGRQLS